MKRNRLVALALLIVNTGLALCGWDWFNSPSVVMDTDARVIYQNIDAQVVIGDFATDDDLAKEKYDGNCYVFHGVISEKSRNNKEITLGEPLTCSTSDKDIIKDIGRLPVGSKVMVYGKLSVGFFGGPDVDIDKIDLEDEKHNSDKFYSTVSGKNIDKTTLKKRTFENTKATFLIPSKWSKVEHDLVGEKLGSMPGYQYRLNELSPKKPYAESLFVCFFDHASMVDINDLDRTDDIEEAIIRDILGKDRLKKYPLTTKKSYYGTQYKYYRDTYSKADIDKYQAEFVFQECSDGMIVYLYIYQEPNNIDDVMLALRFAQ